MWTDIFILQCICSTNILNATFKIFKNTSLHVEFQEVLSYSERRLISLKELGRDLTVKRHEETFSGVRNALYFNCDSGYTNISQLPKFTKQYTYTMGEPFVCTLRLVGGEKRKKKCYRIWAILLVISFILIKQIGLWQTKCFMIYIE